MPQNPDRDRDPIVVGHKKGAVGFPFWACCFGHRPGPGCHLLCCARLQKMLVAMGVTNRGGCTNCQSSRSPLYLGNLKLPKGTALLGVRPSIYVQKK